MKIQGLHQIAATVQSPEPAQAAASCDEPPGGSAELAPPQQKGGEHRRMAVIRHGLCRKRLRPDATAVTSAHRE